MIVMRDLFHDLLANVSDHFTKANNISFACRVFRTAVYLDHTLGNEKGVYRMQGLSWAGGSDRSYAYLS